MKCKHITKILDQTVLAELSPDDSAAIDAHAGGCPDCRQSFEAARLTATLLKACAETSRTLEPSPFFHAKVMNAMRERQDFRKPMAAFRRWWQASAVPVFMMLLTVAFLISLTALAPQSSAEDATAELSSFKLYSTDSVILNQRGSGDLTTEQVFQVIYEPKTDSNR